MKIIIDSFDRISDSKAIVILAIISKEGYVIDKIFAKYHLNEEKGKCFYYILTDFGKHNVTEIDFEHDNKATKALIEWEEKFYNNRGQE